MHARIARGAVTRIGVNAPRQGAVIASRQSQARALRLGPCGLYLKPVRLRYVIQQKPGRTVVIANHDIDVAIVVDISEGGPARYLRQLKHLACARRDIGELTVALIANQQIPFLIRLRLSSLLFFQRNRAIRDEQIQMAVIVEIDPLGPETRVRLSDLKQSRCACRICELRRAIP